MIGEAAYLVMGDMLMRRSVLLGCVGLAISGWARSPRELIPYPP